MVYEDLWIYGSWLHDLWSCGRVFAPKELCISSSDATICFYHILHICCLALSAVGLKSAMDFAGCFGLLFVGAPRV